MTIEDNERFMAMVEAHENKTTYQANGRDIILLARILFEALETMEKLEGQVTQCTELMLGMATLQAQQARKKDAA